MYMALTAEGKGSAASSVPLKSLRVHPGRALLPDEGLVPEDAGNKWSLLTRLPLVFVERLLGLSSTFFLQAGLGHTALGKGKLCCWRSHGSTEPKASMAEEERPRHTVHHLGQTELQL